MPYGWAGTVLEIDLSQGKVERRRTDPIFCQTWLGGKGTNAKMLWDRVSPEVTPFSPENLLIFGAGTLTGTLVPGANRTTVTYKSPVTGLHTYSNMGGSFAAELKNAGYDTIAISGKSPTPVYLWINDDRVEIRDASHLWGKDTCETQEVLRREFEKAKVQTVCIGPAGENRVYGASIEHSSGASASRGGAGAVMGDKKLKAICVYGTKDIALADAARLMELSTQILGRTGPVRKEILDAGIFEQRLIAYITCGGAFGNFGKPLSDAERKQVFDDVLEKSTKYVKEARTREVSCGNCGLRCKHAYPVSGGGYSYLKCSSWSMPMIATKILDCDFVSEFSYRCRKYGLDIEGAAAMVAFSIDIYQRGILTKEDTGGMHLDWKDANVAFSLIDKIVRREGIGDVLGNGIYEAARQIGKGAEDYAYTTRKQDMVLYNFNRISTVMAVAMSDKSDFTRFDNTIFNYVWPSYSKEQKEAYIKSGFYSYPREYDKYLMSEYDPSGTNYEPLLQIMIRDEETYALADSTGICYFWLLFWFLPPINNRQLVADLISSATGLDIDEAGATAAAKRIVNLVRSYNVREGIRRKDDAFPEVFFNKPPSYGYKMPAQDRFNTWVDRWYEVRGWNAEGIPTKKTLGELGLGDVAVDLGKRGIPIS